MPFAFPTYNKYGTSAKARPIVPYKGVIVNIFSRFIKNIFLIFFLK